MKNNTKIIGILGIWMLLLLGNNPASIAQTISSKTIITDSIYVHGVCGMCKDRIENAALIKGVKKVSWNKLNHYLTIIYKPSKVSIEDIQKEVAKAGHDTGEYIAEEIVYNSLPDCCAYRSGDVAPH